jgi:hypothetical protein
VLRRTILLLALAAASLLASSATAAAPTSGLRGAVVLSPSRPVCIEGEPCTAPASGVVLRFSRAGRVVARTTTQANGTYRVALPRGYYVVSLFPERSPRTIMPRVVRVVSGRMTRVDFEIDTGLQ